jgi:RNA polymerase sigma-70 factor, ECF subfamily
MRTKPPHIQLVKQPQSAPASRDRPSAEAHWVALVKQAQQGDVEAFGQLAGDHYQAVYAFSVGLSSDPTEAADIAQESLVKAFRKLGSYRFAASFRSWLLQVTRNTFRDRMRSNQQQRFKLRRLAEQTVPSAPADPEQALMAKQTSAQLHRALARLEPQFREVVVLFDLQGFAYREIAEICGVPMGTVKSRLRRGRDGLRRLLAADGVIGRRRGTDDGSDRSG